MRHVLNTIPYWVLIPAAILLMILPLGSTPHLIEKLTMLKNGTLTRPLDIFDLCFHLAPSVFLVLKIILGAGQPKKEE